MTEHQSEQLDAVLAKSAREQPRFQARFTVAVCAQFSAVNFILLALLIPCETLWIPAILFNVTGLVISIWNHRRTQTMLSELKSWNKILEK